MPDDKKPTPPAAAPLAPSGLLQRDTDRAARPGFRSPANKGSKAQKSGGGKKGKKK